ncbi:MAG: hypothetical protein IPL86_17295 [Flavobacteriales bacterium]|nr:hypothetical protein [Flavobacteriales bacterium]
MSIGYANDFEAELHAELERRGVDYVAIEGDRYIIGKGDASRTIFLENVRRTFVRDSDASAIVKFLDNVITPVGALPSKWEDAAPHLFPMLESSQVERSLDTVAREKSPQTVVTLAYHVEGSGSVRFIRYSDLKSWGISSAQAWDRAQESLDARAKVVDVRILEAGDLRLGALEAHEPYKASILLSGALRSQVEPKLGWPVYAVAPARGFVYLIGSDNFDEIGRLGGVVAREFNESGHPLSTEVWELSDDGMEHVGNFPSR